MSRNVYDRISLLLFVCWKFRHTKYAQIVRIKVCTMHCKRDLMHHNHTEVIMRGNTKVILWTVRTWQQWAVPETRGDSSGHWPVSSLPCWARGWPPASVQTADATRTLRWTGPRTDAAGRPSHPGLAPGTRSGWPHWRHLKEPSRTWLSSSCLKRSLNSTFFGRVLCHFSG